MQIFDNLQKKTLDVIYRTKSKSCPELLSFSSGIIYLTPGVL